MEHINLSIKPRAPVGLSLAVKQQPIKVSVALAGGHMEYYEGAYEVTPKTVSQSLPTAQKTLKQDVLVHEIPYYETSNPSGTTVYIGE